MVKIKKNTITMTRGDTLITTLQIFDANGEEFIPGETDTIRFAAKERYDDEIPLIYKEIPTDTMELRLESYETKSLQQDGAYYYDVEITYGDNIVDTIISGKLIMKSEVI